MNIKKKLKALPNSPGVYLMKDSRGTIIYIGKASSLKRRVSWYFQKANRGTDTKTMALVDHIAGLDYITTASEIEALLLEASLIKQHQPKYNIDLKDGKRYPLLKLTKKEKFPRLLIARQRKKDGSIYYGRYTNAKLLRQAIDIMRKIFPLRTCRRLPKTPCLNYHIGQCFGPCVGKISQKEYTRIVKDVQLFLEGKKQRLIKDLTARMKKASASRRYEQAARLRDQIRALTSVSSLPASVSGEAASLQALLNLPKLPMRIEAFDVSNIFGCEAVGSMVSFFNGSPDKQNYKRFKIKTVAGIDDYAMIGEIVKRRYAGLLKEGRPLPDLVIIDGGRGHVSTAKAALNSLGLETIPTLGIAKKKEHLHILEKKKPIVLKKDSRALQLIQRIRDEAHRFAISYHHILRKKLTKGSILDQIPGIGPKRKQLLIKNFTNFELKVYAAASSIPKGETRPYKWVAESIGSPKAVRAVGNALNKNLFPGVIPCHRVIRSDGSIGGFSKGQAVKKKMLRAEVL